MTGVSFVVPVFNKAPWLPDVLDRIAAQRGAFEREYVFVDDGSTDDSLAVLKAHTAGWPGVTIIEQENRGVAHATNRAIAKARHPLIKLCDADDLLADGATEVLRNALLSHPQAMLAYGKWEFYDPPPPPRDLGADLSDALVLELADPLRFTIRGSSWRPVAMMAVTHAVRTLGGCNESWEHAQDWTLALRLAMLPGRPLVHVDATVGYAPRHVPGQMSTDTDGIMRDMNKGLGWLVSEHRDLSWRLRQLACRRAASRVWRLARRCRAPGRARWLALYLRSLLPIPRGHAEFIARCGEFYRLHSRTGGAG